MAGLMALPAYLYKLLVASVPPRTFLRKGAAPGMAAGCHAWQSLPVVLALQGLAHAGLSPRLAWHIDTDKPAAPRCV